MIKLFSLKQQSKDGLNPQSSKKTSAAYLRVQKGKYNVSESNQPMSMHVSNYDRYQLLIIL